MTTLFNKPMAIVNATLEGQELLDAVHNNIGLSQSALCELTGYAIQNDMRDAISAARMFNGEYKDQFGEPVWDVELLERIQSICNVPQAECIEIAVTLRDDYNVKCEEDFMDIYAYSSEEYRWEAEFAEYWAREVCCFDADNDAGMQPWIVIDWEATWNCNLRYDFDTIEYSDGVIIVHNH